MVFHPIWRWKRVVWWEKQGRVISAQKPVTLMVTPAHLLTGNHTNREQQPRDFLKEQSTAQLRMNPSIEIRAEIMGVSAVLQNLDSFTYYCTDVWLNHALQSLKMKFYTSEFNKGSQLPLQMLCLGEILDQKHSFTNFSAKYS